MQPLYPLRFHPILRRYLWGGRRLGEVLGKPIGEEADYAESWEICDRGDDQSIVANGPLAGQTLASLVRDRGEELLGRHAPQPRFPLLFKFLDCRHKLSVQVHPNDEQAAHLTPADLGKTEAWYILDAEPGATMYAGLAEGTDRAALTEAIGKGDVAHHLHAIEPRAGDCVLIPAGTVHALGEGLLVAEIQQSSDTTYRLHDWDRVGPDGNPRALHIERSLATIDFSRGPARVTRSVAEHGKRVEPLVECDKFVLERWNIAPDTPRLFGGDDTARIVVSIDGVARITGGEGSEPLARGDVFLSPAACQFVELATTTEATLLVAYLP